MLHPGSSYSGSPLNKDNPAEGILLLSLFFLFLCECQVIFGEYFSFTSIQPDLLLIGVIATGVFRGTEQGFWFGLYGGLLHEFASASGSDFGYLILMKMVIGYGCGKLTNSVRGSFVAVPIILIAVGSLLHYECLYYLSADLIQSVDNSILSLMVNAVICGFPVYYLVYFIPGRTNS